MAHTTTAMDNSLTLPDVPDSPTPVRPKLGGGFNPRTALLFFGTLASYYLRNPQALKAVAIDAGAGCVEPSAASVADGSYQPLSRPTFLYVSRASVGRDEVKRFAGFYLAPENPKYLEQLGYAPLPTAALLAGEARLEHGEAGSAMGAHGSVLGVRASDFVEPEERVQSALVQ